MKKPGKKDKNPKNKNSAIAKFLSSKILSYRVGENVYNRIDEHVRVLKYTDKKAIKKKEWFAAALREKLEREKDLGIFKSPRFKQLQFPIDEELQEKLEKRLSVIRKVRPYTAKELVLEAILEKLEREEMKAKALVDQI
jgi:hypothetical protein